VILLLLVVVPAACGLLALRIESVRVDLGILLGAALFHTCVTGALWAGALDAAALGSVLRLDVTGLLFLSITSLLFLVAGLYSVPYILGETHDTQAAPHRFVPCLLWFLSAMTLVTVAHNLAVLWAAVEATTLASAPLVYFYNRKAALEATWKYLLICSVGIALALLGTFFLGIAASSAHGAAPELTVDAMMAAAPTMPRAWLKAAFVLALVGYGTKMGLAPMHTWLPDTHSQAPSPVSALLSGALLNCALLAILRFYQVCLASGDAAFARSLLLLLGFISLVLACAFMTGQRDYKRLLAYSSIENMGIVAIGIGAGGAATYGALLHAVNHSLCKAGLFMLAGNVLRAFGTTKAAEVRGVLRRLPISGGLFLALLLAIGGVPPFGPFVSELIIFRSMAVGPSAWIGIAFVVLLAVAFLGLASVLLPMLQGAPSDERPAPREALLAFGSPALLVMGSLVLGLYIPPLLSDMLHAAARAMGG
jgi:hydrogenase-4 component F